MATAPALRNARGNRTRTARGVWLAAEMKAVEMFANGATTAEVAEACRINIPSAGRIRAYYASGEAASRARILAGKAPGASAVRSLSPEEIAAYEAELLARAAPPPEPEPANLVRVVTVEPVLCGPRTEPKPMTTIESARNLRAELDALTATQAEKRRAALTLADELEQEANALREAAGGVAVKVAPKQKPAAKEERVQIWPPLPAKKPAPIVIGASGKVLKRGGDHGKGRASVLAAVGTTTTPRTVIVESCPTLTPQTVSGALHQLVRQGKVEKVARGMYRRVAS